jgi:RNA-splicing ligase RtcB
MPSNAELPYQVISTDHVPIKAWTHGVPFEAEAQDQLRRVAALPFVHKWVAAMPDVHAGKGATIGSVIASRKAVIPAAVGVDIGCGMMAVKTSLRAEQLPDDLKPLRLAIESAVPHGRTDHGGKNDLAYLPEGSELFADYVMAVEWAQDYARKNRERPTSPRARKRQVLTVEF